MAILIAQLIRTFYDECWNKWNDTLVDDTLDTAFVSRGSLGQQVTGLDGWRGYRDRIRHGSPDLHHELVDLIC